MSTSFDCIKSWLERATGMAVLVLGERIIDEYVEVEPVSQSQTSHLVVFRELAKRDYLGGCDILKGHLLAQGMKVTCPPQGDAIRKRRYLLADGHKLFNVMDRLNVSSWRVEEMESGHLILVADYGQGYLNAKEAKHLAGFSNFLAVTAQARGFSTLAKWPRADYAVVTERELRYQYHDDNSDLRALMFNERRRLDARLLALTRGEKGVCYYDGDRFEAYTAPVCKVIDSMGAGDAFIAATAPLVSLGAPIEVLDKVGQAAASIECGQLGNVPVSLDQIIGRLNETL